MTLTYRVINMMMIMSNRIIDNKINSNKIDNKYKRERQLIKSNIVN